MSNPMMIETEARPRQRAIAWRRPTGDIEEQRITVPYSWYGWGTIHARRWQYTPPWGCTRWALVGLHPLGPATRQALPRW